MLRELANTLADTISNKPEVGIFSSMAGVVLSPIGIISLLSAILGLVIAIITLVIKVIDFIQKTREWKTNNNIYHKNNEVIIIAGKEVLVSDILRRMNIEEDDIAEDTMNNIIINNMNSGQ